MSWQRLGDVVARVLGKMQPAPRPDDEADTPSPLKGEGQANPLPAPRRRPDDHRVRP